MEENIGRINGCLDSPKLHIKVENDVLEESDQDPIVKEIPVFLCKSLAEQLYLFQYPVRPCTLPYDPKSTTILESRVKPGQQKVELTLGINTAGSNFDSSKSEQIALNVDGNNSDQKTFEHGIMDKITLSSQRAVNDSSRYAVGIFNGSEFHLTPLKGIVSLKPSLTYLDCKGKSDQLNTSLADDPESEVEQAEKVQKIGVKFLKNGTEGERAHEMKKKSFEYHQKLEAEEAWIQTDFHHVKSPKWVEQTQKLFCNRLDGEAISGDVKVDEYLQQLKYSF